MNRNYQQVVVQLVTAIALAGIAGLPRSVYSDGMMVSVRPEVSPFGVSYHRVKVDIDRQVATTDIDQAFRSAAGTAVEGTYIFPLAEGISLSKFSMYAGGEELTHRILDKEEARRIYNGIVRVRKDPALLEWLGTRMIQARVFPIQPGEDKRIRVAYQEVLQASGGVIKYVYPLKTAKLSAQPLQECSLDLTIRSEQPIRSVYSPTHNITVRRDTDHIAHVTYLEKGTRPDQDFVLYYTVSEKDLGLDLLTYRDPKEGDGYFLLLAAPKAELRQNEVQPKDMVFVLDTSGSMAGDNKIEQAKAALKFCINNLDRRDRFNVVAFNTELRQWSKGLQQATRDNVKDAEAFVAEFKANGGTNINGSLQTALEMLNSVDSGTRPPVIIFLTDGLPTVGVTDVNQILSNVRRANARHARLFDFGVGHDYNAHFLDKLANENNGYAENVLPKEDIEVKVSDFYAKISTPLLMNVKVDWGDAAVYDLHPRELTDLFKGSQLLMVGRYKPQVGSTSEKLTLTGEVDGRRQTFPYLVAFPAKATDDDFIPRLWATRKIGYLEDQMRLNGTNRELLEEVIRLSKEFGILTEYTSFLVDLDVNAPGGARANVLSKSDAGLARDAEKQVEELRGRVADSSAVSQSVNRKAGMGAQQAAIPTGNVILNERGERVQLSQLRNVAQRNFVQAGTQWIDINYRDTQRTIKVRAFSPAYFQLANAHPRMAQYLSVGKEVTVVLKDLAVQTGSEGQDEELKGTELRDLTAKMNAEFGPAPSEKRAMILPDMERSSPRSPRWAAWFVRLFQGLLA